MAETDAARQGKRSLKFCVVDTFVCPKVTDVREAPDFGLLELIFSLQCRCRRLPFATSAKGATASATRRSSLLPLTAMMAFTKLTVSSAGDCNGDGRTSTRSAGQKAGQKGKGAKGGKKRPQATVEERNVVHEAADFLIQQNLKATPSAIHVRLAVLKKPHVLDNVVSAILGWPRRKLGYTTWKRFESEGSFRATAADKQDPDHGELCFAHMGYWPR